MESNHEFASFKAWRGEIQVTFSVSEVDPTAVAAFIDRVLASGFTAQLKGVEDGEVIVEASAIGRKQQFNADDATYSPVLVLYADKGNFNVGRVYLNDGDELAAARHALGMDIMQIPLYDGEGYIERGKDPNKDKKYIAHLPHSVKAIFKKNPKYNPNPPAGEKKKPQYLFVRWHSTAAAPQAEQQPDKPATPKATNGAHVWTQQEAAAFVAKWKARGYGDDVLKVLGITRMGECKLTVAAADALMEQHAVNTILNAEPIPPF